MGDKLLPSLAETQRLLTILQCREHSEKSLEGNKDIVSFLSAQCNVYVSAFENLMKALDDDRDANLGNMDRLEDFPPKYTGQEVKVMFGQLMGQFSNNLNQFLQKRVENSSDSLLLVGEDALGKVMTFLSSKEQNKMRRVCRLVKRTAEAELVRFLSITLGFSLDLPGRSANRHVCFSVGRDGWRKAPESMLSMVNGATIQRLDMNLCCPTHCQAAFDLADKLSVIRELSIQVDVDSNFTCRNTAQVIPWIRTFFDRHKNDLQALSLSVSDKFLEGGKMNEIFKPFQQLKVLEVLVDSSLDPDEIIDLSFVNQLSCSPEEVELTLLGHNVCIGLVAFPWETCKKLSFQQMRMLNDDWSQILSKLSSCESLELREFALSNGRMGCNEFFQHKSLHNLKELVIVGDLLWLDGNEIPKIQFSQLRNLVLNGDFQPETVIAVCQQSPELQELSIAIRGDLLQWEDSVDSSDIVDWVIESLKANEKLESLQINFGEYHSRLKYNEDERTDRELISSCKAYVEAIRDVLPRLKRFHCLPPGNFSDSKVSFDLSGFLSLGDSMPAFEASRHTFQPQVKDGIQLIGAKRKRDDEVNNSDDIKRRREK
jgi:hypothetical protein